MSTDLSAAALPKSYYSTFGNSTTAQYSRIYQLMTGKTPTDLNYDKMYLSTMYITTTSQAANTDVQKLYEQAEDIQFCVSAMTSAYKGLDEIKARIGVIDGLVDSVKEDPDMDYVTRYNINTQINYTLYEIEEIAQNRNFEKIPVLNGTLKDQGVKVNIGNNEKVDITNAFDPATTEALDLPVPGEAYASQSSASSLINSLSGAKDKIIEQMSRINDYGDTLLNAFSNISKALYESGGRLGVIGSNDTALNSSFSSTLNNGNLVLTMNSLSSNYLVDDNFYAKIKSLLNKD